MGLIYSESDARYFEDKLRARMAQLQGEISEVRDRRDGEQYSQVAGETYDAGDASVANLAVDANSADIRRDDDELNDINDALDRVSLGTYGICMRCGEAIERARLEAYPPARRHVSCQEAHERETGEVPRTPKL